MLNLSRKKTRSINGINFIKMISLLSWSSLTMKKTPMIFQVVKILSMLAQICSNLIRQSDSKIRLNSEERVLERSYQWLMKLMILPY